MDSPLKGWAMIILTYIHRKLAELPYHHHSLRCPSQSIPKEQHPGESRKSCLTTMRLKEAKGIGGWSGSLVMPHASVAQAPPRLLLGKISAIWHY